MTSGPPAPTPADELNDVLEPLAQSTDPVTGAAITAAGPVVTGLVQGQADLAHGALAAGSDAVTGYAHATGDVVSGYAHAGQDAVHTAGQVVNDQVAAYQHAGSAVVDGFEHGDPLGGLAHAGGDLLAGQAQQIGHILTGVGAAAADVGTGVFHGIEDTVGGLTKGVGDMVSGVTKDLEDAGHGVLEGAAHGLKSLFGDGGESKSKILDKFGHEDQDKLDSTRAAAKDGGAELRSLASSINGGDGAAVGTADQVLKPGEAGLAYFSYFLPAYNAWTDQNVTMDQLKAAYEQEMGMSFSAYSADSQLLSRSASSLNASEQSLQNAYNALVPTWQGQAAANFEAKLSVFFKGASATQKQVGEVGTEVSTLVEGLQKLILAKAEAVDGLYADTLPPGIDGDMAMTMVKVAQGQLHDDMRRVVLGIFHLAAHGRHAWDDDGYYSSDDLDDPSRQAAINAATDWCNNVLIQQTEVRLKALSQVCSQTQQRIQQAFAQLVKDIKSLPDPFAGMTTARAPSAPPVTGGGSGPSGGGGYPGGGSTGGGGPTPVTSGAPTSGGPVTAGAPSGGSTFTPPAAPTYPGQPTSSQGVDNPIMTNPGTTNPTSAPGSTGTMPVVPGVATAGTGGTDATPPAGAAWLPPGAVLPTGYNEDPTTGELLPGTPGTTSTGLGGLAGTGAGAGDINKNPDGSVSLGPDRSVTIGRAGSKGVFTLSETGTDGIEHKFHVHFDKDGNPVVHEVHDGHDELGPNLPGFDATDPQSALAGSRGIGGGGSSGGGSSGGSSGGGGGIGGGSGIGGSGVHAGTPAAVHAGGSGDQLQAGVHVGADNATTTSTMDAPGSPVAGSAAPSSGGGEHSGGGIAGVPPMMGGRGAGGGEQEASRKYQQRGDITGEEDLEEWQHMGPVIGEQ